MPAKKHEKKPASKFTVGGVENKVKTFAKSVGKEAKIDVEKKAKLFAKSVEREAKVVKAEGKVIGNKIGSRWQVSSNEEKIYVILGALLLLRGLYYLRGMIWGMILIVLGILFVTGFFLKRKQ